MSTTFTTKVIASAITLVLSNAALAGLGQIQVHSYLGEPFVATIPLTGDTARDAMSPELSSNDQLAKINVMGSSAASNLNFTIVRRKGSSYVRVTSRAPINEPVLSFGVNVQSASGTISRQYSALLDIKESRKVYPSTGSTYTGAGKAPTTYRGSIKTHTVQEGDTLYSIASRFQPAGLSIAQTKRAIFLNNPKAFAKGNPEQLLRGVILHIPSDARMRSLVGSTQKAKVAKKPVRPATTAVKTPPVANANDTKAAEKPKVDAQAKAKADAKLAQAEKLRAEAAKIKADAQAKADAKLAEAEKLKADAKSKADAQVAAAEKAKAEAQAKADAQIAAAQKAKAEAQAKADAQVAAAEKAKADAQAKVDAQTKADAEAKAKADAEAQAKADAEAKAAQAAASAEQPAEAQTASQVEVSAPVDEAELARIAEELRLADEERKRLEQEASEAAAAANQPPPVDPTPVDTSPSIMDTVIKYAPFGLGGLVVLLGGVWAVTRRKGKKVEERSFIDEDSFLDMTAMMGAATTTKSKPVVPKAEAKITAAATQMAETINTPAPVTVDPNRAPSTFMTDFTRMSAAIDTGEIDPLSEAEVYIAYGRNDEAEEILKDALTKDPAQHEVRKKLLEIYANKQEIGNFESMARELYDAFDGRGAIWQEVAQMGLSLDPNNPLYQQAAKLDGAQDASMVQTDEVSEKNSDSIGFASEPEKTPLSEPSTYSDIAKDSEDEAAELAKAKEFDSMFDFTEDEPKSSLSGSQFVESLDTDHQVTTASNTEHSGLEFDLDSVLDDAKDAGTLEEVSLPAVETIDLEQIEPTGITNSVTATADSTSNVAESHSFADDPLSTKLELAKVYIDMGDLDGAKEVLQELVEDADGALLNEAEQMLKKLSL